MKRQTTNESYVLRPRRKMWLFIFSPDLRYIGKHRPSDLKMTVRREEDFLKAKPMN